MYQITPSILEIVKHVLFGNQKQASIQNEAVALIVTEAVFREVDPNSITSEVKFVQSVLMFLDRCKTSTVAQEYYSACRLIVGTKAADLLASGVPVEITAEPAGETTPKYYFFVHSRDAVDEVKHYVEHFDEEAVKELPDTSYKTRVDALRDKLAPLVPDIVKAELGDDYACALWATQYIKNDDIDAIQRQVTELVRRGGDIAKNLERYFVMYRERQ